MAQDSTWRRVSEIRARMIEGGKGRSVVVEVRLRSGDRVRPTMVQPTNEGWVFFQEELDPHRVIAVMQQEVQSVEVRFGEVGKQPLGFSIGEVTGAQPGAQDTEPA